MVVVAGCGRGEEYVSTSQRNRMGLITGKMIVYDRSNIVFNYIVTNMIHLHIL